MNTKFSYLKLIKFFKKISARKIFYHGTSSKYLRKILKHGLLPNPEELQYSGQLTESSSTKTFGGVYFTDDWNTAYHFAINATRNRGGNRTIVVATLETRTQDTWLDEDLVVEFFNEVLRHKSAKDLTSNESFWGNIFHKQNLVMDSEETAYKKDFLLFKPSSWKRIIDVIFSTDLSEPLNEFWELLLKFYPRMKERAWRQKDKIDKLIVKSLRYQSLHLLERGYLNNKVALKNKYNALLNKALSAPEEERDLLIDEYENELYWIENPPMSGTFNSFRNSIDSLSKALPELTDPVENWWKIDIRLKRPLFFSGKNRIISIIEHVVRETRVNWYAENDNYEVEEIRVLYGRLPPGYLEKSGKRMTYAVIQDDHITDYWIESGCNWPEDIWGPLPK